MRRANEIYGVGELSGVKFYDVSEFYGVKILKRLVKFERKILA